MELKIYFLLGFIGVISIGAYLGTFFLFNFNYYERFNDSKEGDNIIIGIITDSLLYIDDKTPEIHLNKSFETMKNHSIDVLIFAGGFGEKGSPSNFGRFNQIFNNTFNTLTTRPILNVIMGNDDYLSFPYISVVKQRRFNQAFKQKPFGHKVIKGFHFINWGCFSHNADSIDLHLLWFQRELKNATDSSPHKPVFVITHYPPHDTVYGSEHEGMKQLTKELEKYPQVISISGHSRYSLMDERSIWQGNFTAVQAQSTSHIELEPGKENGPIPTDETGNTSYSLMNYMGLIVNVTKKRVRIKRVSLENNTVIKKAWTIKLPIKKEEFQYSLEKRKQSSKAPEFLNNSITVRKVLDVQQNPIYQLIFTQATPRKSVHSYKVKIEYNNGKLGGDYFYFSDFFLLKRKRKIVLKLPPPIQKNKTHLITIYAIESFGKISLPISKIIAM